MCFVEITTKLLNEKIQSLKIKAGFLFALRKFMVIMLPYGWTPRVIGDSIKAFQLLINNKPKHLEAWGKENAPIKLFTEHF